MAGGSIVPMHIFESQPAMTTTEVRRSPLTLLVALKDPLVGEMGAKNNETQESTGSLYFDDGESVEIGRSPCNFLSFSLRVERLPSWQQKAELDVRFTAPPGFEMAQNSNEEYLCEGFEWPNLVGLKVLGWQLPLDGAVLMENFRPEGINAAGEAISLKRSVHKLDQASQFAIMIIIRCL